MIYIYTFSIIFPKTVLTPKLIEFFLNSIFRQKTRPVQTVFVFPLETFQYPSEELSWLRHVCKYDLRRSVFSLILVMLWTVQSIVHK